MPDSRNKGSAFERQIAARLLGLTGVTFRRNLEQVRAEDQSDLMPDDPGWPFAIECKRYAEGTGCKPAWRAQASKAAVKLNKIPAVIFKFDRRDVWVSVPFTAFNAAFGGADESGQWAEVTLEGLAFLAAEIMAGSAKA